MANMLARLNLNNTGCDAVLDIMLEYIASGRPTMALELSLQQTNDIQRRLLYWMGYLIARDSDKTEVRAPASALAAILDPDKSAVVDFEQASVLARRLGPNLAQVMVDRQASAERLDQPDRPEPVRALVRQQLHRIEFLAAIHSSLLDLLDHVDDST